MATLRFDHDGATFEFDDRWMDVPTCMWAKRELGLTVTDWARGLQPSSYDAAALVAMVHVALRRAGVEVRLVELLQPGTVDLLALVRSIAEHKQALLAQRVAEVTATAERDQADEQPAAEQPADGGDTASA